MHLVKNEIHWTIGSVYHLTYDGRQIDRQIDRYFCVFVCEQIYFLKLSTDYQLILQCGRVEMWMFEDLMLQRTPNPFFYVKQKMHGHQLLFYSNCCLLLTYMRLFCTSGASQPCH